MNWRYLGKRHGVIYGNISFGTLSGGCDWVKVIVSY